MTNQPDVPSAVLNLTSVVASGLPTDLGSATASTFYDVPAVFNRRPAPEEMDALRGSEGHDYLVRAGYPDVRMDVRDRRLIISRTNLGQLERGLATVIANYVDSVSRAALSARTRKQDAAQLAMDERTERAAEVTRAATRVRFIPHTTDTSEDIDTAALAQLSTDGG